MANSTNFCNVNNNGNSNNWNASNSHGVRPISRACFASSSNGETKFAGNQERKRPARVLKLEQTEPLDSYRSIKSTDKVYTKLFVDN